MSQMLFINIHFFRVKPLKVNRTLLSFQPDITRKRCEFINYETLHIFAQTKAYNIQKQLTEEAGHYEMDYMQ